MWKRKLVISLAMISVGTTAYGGNVATEAVDAFEAVFGVTEGNRRNHTKGFCFNANWVTIDKSIQQYSTSALFTNTSSVIGRLSHKGGNDTAPDNKPGEYGIALSINTASNEQHRMSLNTLDFFPVSTPEAFVELMQAKHKGKEALKAFKAKYPQIKKYKAHVSQKDKTLKPYEGMTFNSINSFYLVNKSGEKTPIRWSFRPTQPQKIVVDPSENFYFANIQKNLQAGDVSWDMVVTIANPGDAINDAAVQWTGKHKEIVAARLTVVSVSTEQDGQCDTINYDPLMLSKGFEPSSDPLLNARRSSYAVSFGRRLQEKAK